MERRYEVKKGALCRGLSIVPRVALSILAIMSGAVDLSGVTTFNTSNTLGTPAGQALYYSSSDPIAAVPTLISGDSFDGWVFFNSGLALPQGASITLNTVGILGGALDFGHQNSTLVLGQDLQCRSDFSITGTAGGRITGNGNVLKLGVIGRLTIS